MISPERRAEIRRLFYAEHWKIGTIAAELGLHHDTVRAAVETDRFVRPGLVRPSALDPYHAVITETLTRHPRLRTTRLHEMLWVRGYRGSVVQLRRLVARIRPRPAPEAFLRLTTLPGEEAQVDWGHFGHLNIGRARRPVMGFVMVLSHARAVHAEFFLDQAMESFLLGHVRAFDAFGGVPRRLLYDNLKSAILERAGQAIRFNPRLLELGADPLGAWG
jgi:transposase